MENIKIVNLTSQNIVKYKECFDNNGSPKKLENLDWQFFQNPVDTDLVGIAYDDKMDRAAAIYALFGLQFKVGNQSLLGSQSLDTMTDSNYRGQGLFTVLSENVDAKAASSNVVLVFGFPNGNSVQGYVKKRAWQILDPLPFLIKPLKSKYFTDKIKPLSFLPNINLSWGGYSADKNFKIVEKHEFPDSVNAIWQTFSAAINVAVQRDKAYLDWRYIKKPNQDYKIAHCYDNQNKYLGFVVYTVKEKHNGKIAYIMELMYDLAQPKAGHELLKYAVSEIKKQNADCILSWSMEHSPNYSAYKKSFFVNMPEKIRPIELHFGVGCFREDLKSLIFNRNNWYISYSDSDTV